MLLHTVRWLWSEDQRMLFTVVMIRLRFNTFRSESPEGGTAKLRNLCHPDCAPLAPYCRSVVAGRSETVQSFFRSHIDSDRAPSTVRRTARARIDNSGGLGQHSRTGAVHRNPAIFDVANQFTGSIAGIHEVLRR